MASFSSSSFQGLVNIINPYILYPTAYLNKIGSNCSCMIQGLQKVLRGPKDPAIAHGSSCTIVEVIKLCLQHILIQWPYHFIWWSWNCGGIVCSHQLAHHFSIEFWLPEKWNNMFDEFTRLEWVPKKWEMNVLYCLVILLCIMYLPLIDSFKIDII